ncbi:MAG: glucoamylase family protein [Thermomonas sp.]
MGSRPDISEQSLSDPAWPADDDAFLDLLQRAAFAYFPEQLNRDNGLVADTSRDNAPISIAVVGFALSAYPVAVERGWMSRNEAVQHSLAALRFFRDCDQSGGADATGYKGFFYHFLDAKTGRRVWRSELSMIDTALLIAGALTAAMYFDADTAQETELRAIADALYLRIDWRWAQDGCETIKQGWKPESGFLHYGWEGYSEAIILYALAMGSPTFPVHGNCYDAWTMTYQWENLYGYNYLYAGPLFVHQFSHAWVDLRDIQDPFMRDKRCDYFENSRRAVHVQREYARINPRGHTGFDEDCWGLSAGDGPSDELPDTQTEPRRLFGYSARGVPYGPDDGTLSPPAQLACLPFAPDITLQGVRTLFRRYPEIIREGRMTSGINPGYSTAMRKTWISEGHFGLDQGIVVLMIENHRSGLVWRLMRQCPYLVAGLRAAGFRGGWLNRAVPRLLP